MRFSVVIPTRGSVDLTSIIESYNGVADEVLFWDNSKRENLSVYGRYSMIKEARNELIVSQDDDCVLPSESIAALVAAHKPGHIICNLPAAFRKQAYYNGSGVGLVGFGAVFQRDLPFEAFQQFHSRAKCREALFRRECDRVVTYLSRKILLDLPKQDLPWANAKTALWKQREHLDRRQEMLDLLKSTFPRAARTIVA